MFDLEKSVAEWRRQMCAAGIKSSVSLLEMENHLREEVERQMCLGLSAQAAFEMAVAAIGQATQLAPEFNKVAGWDKAQTRRLAGFFYASILGFYLLATVRVMFKSDLSAGEWLMGLTAQMVLLLASYLLWRNAGRFLPSIASRRVQSAIGLIGGVSGVVWFLAFAWCLLPRFDLTAEQLVVAILWAMVPTLLLPNIGFLWLDGAENHRAKSIQ
jgi:hypothetical protein